MRHHLILLSICVAATLAACSGKSGGAPAITAAQSEPAADPPTEKTASARTRDPMSAFVMAPGSSGRGEVMSELRKHGGELREPEVSYTVYDTPASLGVDEASKQIQAQLEKDERILIDSDGTPESRKKAAELTYAAIGASIDDIAAVLIRKGPDDKGGGYLLIPIYSKADVAGQVARGVIPAPEAQSNSASNFFFTP